MQAIYVTVTVTDNDKVELSPISSHLQAGIRL